MVRWRCKWTPISGIYTGQAISVPASVYGQSVRRAQQCSYLEQIYVICLQPHEALVHRLDDVLAVHAGGARWVAHPGEAVTEARDLGEEGGRWVRGGEVGHAPR